MNKKILYYGYVSFVIFWIIGSILTFSFFHTLKNSFYVDLAQEVGIDQEIQVLMDEKFEFFEQNKILVKHLPAIVTSVVFHDLNNSEKVIYSKSAENKMTKNIKIFSKKNKNEYVTISFIYSKRHKIADFVFYSVWIFLSFLFILSLVFVRSYFRRHLEKPLSDLEDSAVQLLQGNYEIEFNDSYGAVTEFADIIKLLARNLQKNSTELTRRIQAMDTINKMDKLVLSSISRAELLDSVVYIFGSLFISDTNICIAIRDESLNGFKIISSFGDVFDDDFFVTDEVFGGDANSYNEFFDLTKTGKNSVYLELFKNVLHEDLSEVVNAPILINDNYIGSLLLYKHENYFSENDLETIKMLTAQVGVALHSITIFQEKEDLLLGILQALVNAIDAKSKWTAGHSRRVAAYSEVIQIKLQAPEISLNNLRLSCLLHDIGKIAISETILDKPGRLTPEEYDIMKKHPEFGAKIIQNIPTYREFIPGVLYHHEALDGTGYPEGLEGEEIPFIARIVSVADVFDALTSYRPYRESLTMDEALEFLKERKGIKFEPRVVDAFDEVLNNDHSIFEKISESKYEPAN